MSIDNQQTTRLGAVTPADDQPRRGRKRKAGVVGGVIGTVVALGGGVALAAILLTTNVTGATTVTEVNTRNDIDVTASSADGSRLVCSPISIDDDNTTLNLNPKLSKPVGGPNSNGTAPIAGGTCTVKLTVKNTGDVPIRLDTVQTVVTFPQGWSVTRFEGPATGSIAVGATAVAEADITANQDAVSGPITGKLVYTDAPAA